MKRLERMSELRETLNAARAELGALEAQERDEAHAEIVGKCFRYRNAGGGQGDRWWLYLRVLRCEDGGLVSHKFQIMPSGSIEIDPEHMDHYRLSDAYEEIAERDFHRAWAECQALVAAMPKPVVPTKR